MTTGRFSLGLFRRSHFGLTREWSWKNSKGWNPEMESNGMRIWLNMGFVNMMGDIPSGMNFKKNGLWNIKEFVISSEKNKFN